MNASTPIACAPLVCLAPSEIILAANVGVLRQAQNIAKGRANRFGFVGDEWQVHIEGALGELALSKHLGVFWNGNLGRLDADDVGAFQVRTRSRDSYQLILHPTDPDDRPFVLARGRNGRYSLVGWIMGRDGKRPAYWRDPAGGRPAYFVPDEALYPIETLGLP